MLTSDAELARHALAGSQEAYRTLVDRYATAAVNVATRLVNDRALAEDLAQEAFVRAFARLSTYSPERRFSAWFFQVLHNVAIDHLRRRRVDTVSLDALQEQGYRGPPAEGRASSPEADMEHQALATAIGGALSRIRPESKEAIVLRYQQGLTVVEIADVLQVAEGTVKTFLHRGRKELAAMLSAAGWNPTREGG